MIYQPPRLCYFRRSGGQRVSGPITGGKALRRASSRQGPKRPDARQSGILNYISECTSLTSRLVLITWPCCFVDPFSLFEADLASRGGRARENPKAAPLCPCSIFTTFSSCPFSFFCPNLPLFFFHCRWKLLPWPMLA